VRAAPCSPPLTSAGEGTSNKDPYYYNLESGDSTWEMPDELAWEKVEDESNPGQFYWANRRTGEAQWDVPTNHAWSKVSDEL
jgi:hypothetical protein